MNKTLANNQCLFSINKVALSHLEILLLMLEIVFKNLDSVASSPFSNLITTAEEGNAIFKDPILSDTSNMDNILA